MTTKKDPGINFEEKGKIRQEKKKTDEKYDEKRKAFLSHISCD
jgi:hypothetical protein